ncbi:MAG: DUF1464 family protein, partial [Chloroflexota bacterium]|nr:DUF1464 family protein [Chloroflexota bacterium]
VSRTVRAIGIDPGTVSFDVCGLEGERVFLDQTIPTERLASHPATLVDVLEQAGPMDLIVGPSGYGLPWVTVQALTPREKGLLLLSRKGNPGDETIIAGMGALLALLKESGLPIVLAPAVIHLPTVPAHRKVNRVDMGTCDKVCAVALGAYDKVCAVALGAYDQARRLDVGYHGTSFLYVELGGAFTALVAVHRGAIVDGMGGTSGSLGYRAAGAMDGEVAYLLGEFPKGTLGSGGVASIAGQPEASPEQLIARADTDRRCRLAWDAFTESLVKGTAALLTVAPATREILLSGRLCRVPPIYRRVEEALAPFAPVRRVSGFARVAKEAAQGAALIAEGLAGGRHQGLVEAMRLREAEGTALDHLYVAGSEAVREEYGA